MWFLAVVGVASIIIFMYVLAVAGLTGSLLVGIPTAILVAALIATAIYRGIKKHKVRSIQKRKDEWDGIATQPGLITMKYRSWKEKVCPMVKFEEV